MTDNHMRDIIRSVQRNPFVNHYLKPEEIQTLYFIVKEGQLPQETWNRSTPINSSKPSYGRYKLNFEQFKDYFYQISTWTQGDNPDLITRRVFKILDEDDDGYINFLQFLQIVTIVCKSDLEMRLKLLYSCHLINLSEDEGDNSRGNTPHDSPPDYESEIEEAEEVTESFESSGKSSFSSPSLCPIKIADLFPSWSMVSSSLADLAPSVNTKPYNENRPLPTMNPDQFRDLLSTLYDIVSVHEEVEQQMYQCIAFFGKTLFKAAKLAHHQRNKQNKKVVSANSSTVDRISLDNFVIVSQAESYIEIDSQSNYKSGFITFDQFKATFCIKESLVKFFSTKTFLFVQ